MNFCMHTWKHKFVYPFLTKISNIGYGSILYSLLKEIFLFRFISKVIKSKVKSHKIKMKPDVFIFFNHSSFSLWHRFLIAEHYSYLRFYDSKITWIINLTVNENTYTIPNNVQHMVAFCKNSCPNLKVVFSSQAEFKNTSMSLISKGYF